MPYLAHFIFFLFFSFAMMMGTGTLNTYTATQFIQRTWTSKDGLEESNTYSLAQSTSGILYAVHGTSGFISSLDGYRVTPIPAPESHSKLMVDDQNILWLSISENEKTRISGFQSYNPENRQWIPFMFQHFFAGITIPITRWKYYPILNTQIIFSHSSSIYSFDLNTQLVKTLYSLNPGNEFLSTSASYSLDEMWFPYNNGILQMTIQTQNNEPQFHINSIMDDDFNRYMPIQNILALNHAEWYGISKMDTDKSTGLVQFQQNHLDLLYQHNEPLLWGWKQADNTAWIIDTNNRLALIDLANQTEMEAIDLNSQVQDISLQSNASFFLAAQHGINMFMPSLFQPVPDMPEQSKTVHSIIEDSHKRIWLAAVDSIFMLENTQWKKYELPSGMNTISAYSHSLCELSDGRIAIICAQISLNSPYDFPPYILVFNPSSETFEQIPHPQNRSIFSFVQRNQGKLWVKTKNSETGQYMLELFNQGQFSDRFNQIDIPDLLDMRSLVETASGKLWISHVNSHGPGVFDGSQYRVYGKNEGYSGSGVFYVMEDMSQTIWAGSRDELFHYQNEEWILIQDGLDAVRSIIQSQDGSIWIASGNGLHHYKNNAWVTYNEKDSLPSSHVFEVYEDSLGRIWAGTASGVCIYYPEHDKDEPETWIDLAENNKNFAHKNIAQIKASGMDKWKFTQQEQLLFSYQTGESEWSAFQSSPLLQIHDLQPGNHTLHVRAMDRNFNVDATPSEFSIYVNPIPLQDRPFFIPLVIGIVGLLTTLSFLLLRSRYKLAYYTKHLETLVLDRTKKLQEAEHLFINAVEHEQQRIGNELHDGVVQDLAAVAMTGEVIAKELNDADNPYSKEVQKIVNMIDRSAKQIRGLSKDLSPIQLDYTGLISKVEQLTNQTNLQFAVQCLLEWDEQPPAIESTKMLHIFRFVQEAVNNANKHSQAGMVRISLQHQNNQFCIQVQDNGIGMKIETLQNKGMGFHTLQYRADELGGVFSIESQPNKGTKVICSIPMNPVQSKKP